VFHVDNDVVGKRKQMMNLLEKRGFAQKLRAINTLLYSK